MSAQKLTREQAAIVGLYTGVCCGPFEDIHELAEKVLERPIFTHEFPSIREELKAKSKAIFVAICADKEGL